MRNTKKPSVTVAVRDTLDAELNHPIYSQPGKTFKDIFKSKADLKLEIEFLSARIRHIQGYLITTIRSDERRCMKCLAVLPKESVAKNARK